jgi:ribosomal protein S18 acetylase RimI-like enzyme
MERIRLRPASNVDIDRLFEVHRLATRPYVEQVWGWDDDWQAAYFREHFDVTARQVVCWGERVIGFLDVIHETSAVVLQSIEIEPEFQGRGIGSELIRGVNADAERNGLAVKLRVLKVNARARRLYERLGFVQVGESETHFHMRRV